MAIKGFSSDFERCARRFLTDFRSGLLGQLALEWPTGYRFRPDSNKAQAGSIDDGEHNEDRRLEA